MAAVATRNMWEGLEAYIYVGVHEAAGLEVFSRYRRDQRFEKDRAVAAFSDRNNMSQFTGLVRFLSTARGAVVYAVLRGGSIFSPTHKPGGVVFTQNHGAALCIAEHWHTFVYQHLHVCVPSGTLAHPWLPHDYHWESANLQFAVFPVPAPLRPLVASQAPVSQPVPTPVPDPLQVPAPAPAAAPAPPADPVPPHRTTSPFTALLAAVEDLENMELNPEEKEPVRVRVTVRTEFRATGERGMPPKKRARRTPPTPPSTPK